MGVFARRGVRVAAGAAGVAVLVLMAASWMESLRTGRHESEYFDPARPVDKTEGDARWAQATASAAVAAVATALA